MKIDLNKNIIDQKGETVYTDAAKTEQFTLGVLVCTALLGEYQQERIDGPEKHRRFKLWSKIKAGGVQEISIEEAALFKSLIGMGWGPIVVGQAWDLLEG